MKVIKYVIGLVLALSLIFLPKVNAQVVNDNFIDNSFDLGDPFSMNYAFLKFDNTTSEISPYAFVDFELRTGFNNSTNFNEVSELKGLFNEIGIKSIAENSGFIGTITSSNDSNISINNSINALSGYVGTDVSLKKNYSLNYYYDTRFTVNNTLYRSATYIDSFSFTFNVKVNLQMNEYYLSTIIHTYRDNNVVDRFVLSGINNYKIEISRFKSEIDYQEGYDKGLEDGLLSSNEEAYNKGFIDGGNDSFNANLHRWIVPAIIIVLVLGGVLYFKSRGRWED